MAPSGGYIHLDLLKLLKQRGCLKKKILHLPNLSVLQWLFRTESTTPRTNWPPPVREMPRDSCATTIRATTDRRGKKVFGSVESVCNRSLIIYSVPMRRTRARTHLGHNKGFNASECYGQRACRCISFRRLGSGEVHRQVHPPGNRLAS